MVARYWDISATGHLDTQQQGILFYWGHLHQRLFVRTVYVELGSISIIPTMYLQTSIVQFNLFIFDCHITWVHYSNIAGVHKFNCCASQSFLLTLYSLLISWPAYCVLAMYWLLLIISRTRSSTFIHFHLQWEHEHLLFGVDSRDTFKLFCLCYY